MLIFLFGCEDEITFSNTPPGGITIDRSTCNIWTGGGLALKGQAEDEDGDPLTYRWSADEGTFSPPDGKGASVIWTAPPTTGEVEITLTVSDSGSEGSKTITLEVNNRFPEEMPSGPTRILDNGYPYILVNPGKVTVPSSSTLRIGAGVAILVNNEAGGLEVHGEFFVDGTEGNEVEIGPNACGESDREWAGIIFIGTTASGALSYLNAYNAKHCVELDEGAEVLIDNCRLHDNTTDAVRASEGSLVEIRNSIIWSNSVGIDIYSSPAVIFNSSIRYNSSTGIIIVDTSETVRDVTINNSTIANNGGNGVYIAHRAKPVINNNAIFLNEPYSLIITQYFWEDSLNAENNFWGSGNTDEQSIEAVIYDKNDSPQTVNAYVDFIPWLYQEP